VTEVESYINLCTRSLEGADQLTRRSLASVVGYILSSTQVEIDIDQPEPDISGRSRMSEDDRDSTTSPGAITSEDRRSVLSPSEMLAQLSAQFNKPSASRKIRIGICDFYANLLANLGPTYIEKHYPAIVHHFLTDLISNPRNTSTRYDILLVRRLVCILLRDLIGERLLSEQGQIAAIQELASSYLKKWPALMPGQVEPSHLVLSVVLKEVAGLLHQLGNAPPPVQVRVDFINALSSFEDLGRMLLRIH
jgi:HEAT repeat-containing protein 5